MILSISWPCDQSNLKLWAEGWLLYCYTNHCWKYNSHNNDEEELNKSVMTLDDHKIAPSLNLSKKVSTIIFQEHKKIVCISYFLQWNFLTIKASCFLCSPHWMQYLLFNHSFIFTCSICVIIARGAHYGFLFSLFSQNW